MPSKLRINVSTLLAAYKGLALPASAVFEVEILDETGKVVGKAAVDFYGKIESSGYTREYEIK